MVLREIPLFHAQKTAPRKGPRPKNGQLNSRVSLWPPSGSHEHTLPRQFEFLLFPTRSRKLFLPLVRQLNHPHRPGGSHCGQPLASSLKNSCHFRCWQRAATLSRAPMLLAWQEVKNLILPFLPGLEKSSFLEKKKSSTSLTRGLVRSRHLLGSRLIHAQVAILRLHWSFWPASGLACTQRC